MFYEDIPILPLSGKEVSVIFFQISKKPFLRPQGGQTHLFFSCISDKALAQFMAGYRECADSLKTRERFCRSHAPAPNCQAAPAIILLFYFVSSEVQCGHFVASMLISDLQNGQVLVVGAFGASGSLFMLRSLFT